MFTTSGPKGFPVLSCCELEDALHPRIKKIKMPYRRAELNVYYYSRSKKFPVLPTGWNDDFPIFRVLCLPFGNPDLPAVYVAVYTSTWPLGPKLGCRDARNPFIFLKSGRALSQTTIPSPLSHCVPLCALSVRSREI